MSAPTFVPSRNEVWYSDGMYGFYVVRLTNRVWSPTVTPTVTPADTAARPVAGPPVAPGPPLPRTGWTEPLLLVAAVLVVALGTARLTSAARRLHR
jgi:hypothetical protein